MVTLCHEFLTFRYAYYTLRYITLRVQCESTLKVRIFCLQITLPRTLMEPLLKWNSSYSLTFLPSSSTILLVVWFANGNGSALPKASSKVNLLSDETYRRERTTELSHPSDKKSKVHIK